MDEQQLSLLDDVDTEEIHAAALFKPNGGRRCPGCQRPMTAFGGRAYCMNIGCPGGAR